MPTVIRLDIFLDYTGKPWNELIIDDADAFLNRKKVIWSHAGNL
mgnify:CR=1 FL=1